MSKPPMFIKFNLDERKTRKTYNRRLPAKDNQPTNQPYAPRNTLAPPTQQSLLQIY